MNKINKKGMDAKELVKWALAIIFFVVMVFIFTGDMSGHTKKLKEVLKSGDFDGDNSDPANMYVSDIVDPCPCGTNNNKEPLVSESKDYCVTSHNAQQCADINLLANSVYKEETGKKDLKKFFFFEGSKCMYTVQGCEYYILYGNI